MLRARSAVKPRTGARRSVGERVRRDGKAKAGTEQQEDTRLPVSVLTGFLGSGKSTLLNRILRENHGKRIAVIENEFGDVDIDSELVAAESSGSENVLMLNNGCLCCTVRSDLVQMLSELINTQRSSLDAIIIETTGLANPGPIIQTFYLEDELARSLRLDGVVTLVDAKHCHLHLDHPTKGTSQASHEQEQRQGQQEDPLAPDNEAVAQIAYSDRIILNKADLVGFEQLNSELSRVRSINALASVQTAEHAQVDADYVLGVGGFNLDRVVNQVDSLLLEGDSAQSHEHAHHSSDKTHEHHDHYHDEHEHHHHHHHDHSHGVHNDAVTSVALTMDGEVDIDLVNDWLGALLEDNWQNIYRMKGVLAIEGCDERYVFQGVHSLFEGTPEQTWGENEKRANKLVLIGQDLPPREELEEAFRDCLAVEE